MSHAGESADWTTNLLVVNPNKSHTSTKHRITAAVRPNETVCLSETHVATARFNVTQLVAVIENQALSTNKKCSVISYVKYSLRKAKNSAR